MKTKHTHVLLSPKSFIQFLTLTLWNESLQAFLLDNKKANKLNLIREIKT
jgi:hypothetical protein